MGSSGNILSLISRLVSRHPYIGRLARYLFPRGDSAPPGRPLRHRDAGCGRPAPGWRATMDPRAVLEFCMWYALTPTNDSSVKVSVRSVSNIRITVGLPKIHRF